jgi:hypothetical protein
VGGVKKGKRGYLLCNATKRRFHMHATLISRPMLITSGQNKKGQDNLIHASEGNCLLFSLKTHNCHINCPFPNLFASTTISFTMRFMKLDPYLICFKVI